MDYAIFSILGLALVAFLVYVTKEQRRLNDLKKAVRDRMDFDEEREWFK